MTDKPAPPPPKPAANPARNTRQEKLARALRENLQRRKAATPPPKQD